MKKYQKFSVATQASLSVLNLSQQVVIQGTMLVALLLTAKAVLERGMPVGDFVAIAAYISSLFSPLSFLGTIYGAVIQAFLDMEKLSQLLEVKPDVKDSPSAGDVHDLILQHKVGPMLLHISVYIQSMFSVKISLN